MQLNGTAAAAAAAAAASRQSKARRSATAGHGEAAAVDGGPETISEPKTLL